MEKKNVFLLSNTEEFLQGDLDNVTMSDGRIVLDMVSGSYVPYGCYTSPAFQLSAFDALRPSWNASAPAGSAIEVQTRVLVDGNWTSWLSFGKWSPFMRREGAAPMSRGPLVLTRDRLKLVSKVATQAQLRVYLYSNQAKITPAVKLLGAAARTVDCIPTSGSLVHGSLRLPPYALAGRAPSLAGGMDLAISLASLINRWGADILPEELAMAMFDWRDEHYPNLSFATAVAGCWGFPSWCLWTDLAGLRGEIRRGYGAIVSLYATPAERAAGLPRRRYMALRGFAAVDGVECALLNDPCAQKDFDAEISMPMDDFLVAWNNVALFLRNRTAIPVSGRPSRSALSLRPAEGEAPGVCMLYQGNGDPLVLPDNFCGAPDTDAPTGILAWTVRDGVAHATTAHKQFHFTNPTAGGIALPVEPETPRKFTVYVIDYSGKMLVGDITL